MVTPTDLGIDVGSIFQPVIDVIRPFLATLSLIFGGIFGLYVLLIILRVVYERKKVKLLRSIRFNTDQLNKHYGLPYSTQKKGLIGKAVHYVRGRSTGEKEGNDKKSTKNSKKKD